MPTPLQTATVLGDYEDDDDESNDANAESTNASLWGDTIHKIKLMIENQLTIIYVDFVKDVIDISDTFSRHGIKVGRFTGIMKDKD